LAFQERLLAGFLTRLNNCEKCLNCLK